jgi:hypothetical protein
MRHRPSIQWIAGIAGFLSIVLGLAAVPAAGVVTGAHWLNLMSTMVELEKRDVIDNEQFQEYARQNQHLPSPESDRASVRMSDHWGQSLELHLMPLAWIVAIFLVLNGAGWLFTFWTVRKSIHGD